MLCISTWQRKRCSGSAKRRKRQSPRVRSPETEACGRRRYTADLLIALLQNYAAAAVLFPAVQGDSDAALEELPEPMLPGNWDGATGACVQDESLHQAAVSGAQAVLSRLA